MRAAAGNGRGSRRTGSAQSSPASPPALTQRCRGGAGGQCVVVRAQGNDGGPGEWVRQLMDFGSWAPKSSRAWRLGQTPNDPNAEPDAVDDLQARLQQQAQPPSTSSSSSSSSGSASGGAAVASSNGSVADGSADSVAEDLPPTGSFSEADDGLLSQMLSKRIQSMSGSLDEEAGRAGAVEDGPQAAAAAGVTAAADEDPDGLSGDEMRQLILAKYGKTYDVSLVRRDGFGKSFVAMNITWQHLEQRSFRMTEEQYMEKISSVAYLLNLLGQTTRVRSFLQSPAKSERGLPRRPVVGTAISVQLDLPQNLIDEFFGAGYY